MVQSALIAYLVALRSEGFSRIHASAVIPARATSHSWTEARDIDQTLLDNAGIVYERDSGWFTLDSENFYVDFEKNRSNLEME